MNAIPVEVMRYYGAKATRALDHETGAPPQS
jgi:hypothetical protein